MTPLLHFIPAILISYLVGAIPFGYLIARWHGVDLFKHGSGNIGATNVGRILGWQSGIWSSSWILPRGRDLSCWRGGWRSGWIPMRPARACRSPPD